ncbi:hypothetical protein [Halorussus marinus]|uniref:hypothetical protein n=1 Tax=Halorussus marinus TaxID=2505976 RepID=UPI0010930A64|nr:hypothetical protein [Halorussus marinus]
MKGTSVVVLIGLLVVLAGIAMPSTQTSTVEGCVSGERDIPGDGHCSGIESTTKVTTSNPTKAPTIGFGILLVLIGGVMGYNTGFSDSASGRKSDTVLRASSEVVDLETGETTTLVLPVHTDNVEVAIERFKSRCVSEGYEIKEEPNVEVEAKSQGPSDTGKVQSNQNTDRSDNIAVRRWRKADGPLEKGYLIAAGLAIFWFILVVVLGIIGILV